MGIGSGSEDGVTAIKARVDRFLAQFGVEVPILLAPMSEASPLALSIAVANAGGMGACGALLMEPAAIAAWVADSRAGLRQGIGGSFQVNLWIPEREARRDAEQKARPTAVSSSMGILPAEFVAELQARGILWLATATTVEEARLAESAGADVIVAQGMAAGGHRGAFEEADAEGLVRRRSWLVRSRRA